MGGRGEGEQRDEEREGGERPGAAVAQPHWCGSPHDEGPSGSRPVASSSAARAHGLWAGPAGSGGGAVSRMKRSSAATTAAASSGEALGATISSLGRRLTTGRGGYRRRSVPELPVLDHDSVLAAVSPGEAIDRVREAFVAHHRGDWVMPAKVYVDSPPHGDFRAMPAAAPGSRS